MTEKNIFEKGSSNLSNKKTKKAINSLIAGSCFFLFGGV